MKFYTSDLHFYHKNVIQYENRPFDSVESMNAAMIANWNKKVGKNDEVYILGDFGFCSGEQANELLRSLNGRKYLILGNHDSYFLRDKAFDRNLFQWIKPYDSVRDHNDRVVLFHYPIAVWDRKHHGSLHLYGHVHSNMTTDHPLEHPLEGAYNVGVDVCNFEPKTLQELKDM